MKNIFLLLLAVLTINLAQAQDDDKAAPPDTTKEKIQYQGLLWEITGNGLEKPSYLYGTMHVSRKIAFNLDDIFFEVLKKSDMVAVESMPDGWLDYMFELGGMGYGGSLTRGGGFYGYNYGNRNFYSSAFRMTFPNKMDIVNGMFGQYQLINGILYRSDGNVDFEEDTYLDMFIYQAGKKFGKETFSLEGNKESRDLVEKASQDARKKEIDDWLEEMMEKKNTRSFDIIQDAYRDRNIGLIDSVNRALYTDNYMKYMLFERNENMVDSMETLMRKGSLFTGVGASHLPGDDGMIDMLRKRGYILKPIFSDQTEKGKALKTKFEDTFIKKEYKPQTTEDGFITLNCPGKMYEMFADGGSISLAPDYDNGAYVTISRLYHYNKLRKKPEQLNEDDLDKLLFEFIPGEILSKKVLSEPFPGFDIKNKTKTGNHQRYMFFVTPLEIIIIKMDGKKEFVLNESENIFPTIKFTQHKGKTRQVTSNFGGYEADMAGYTILNNTKYRGKRFVQALNEETGDFAFITEKNLNDVNYIEQDSFELHYMMERFCENMETELDTNNCRYVVEKNIPAFYSYTVVDSVNNKKLHLNTRLISERFYLVGFLGTDEAATDFFKTVKIKPFTTYAKTFEEQVDTNLHYTVHSLERDKISDYYSSGYYYNRKKKDDKNYEGYTKSQSYSINSNEEISIRLKKYHDWVSYDNIDSLWAEKQRDIKELKFELKDEKMYQKDTVYYYEGIATRDFSQRAIKFKYIHKNGVLYTLRTQIHQGMPLRNEN